VCASLTGPETVSLAYWSQKKVATFRSSPSWESLTEPDGGATQDGWEGGITGATVSKGTGAGVVLVGGASSLGIGKQPGGASRFVFEGGLAKSVWSF